MDFINSILSDRWLPITIVIVSPLIAFIIDLLFSLIFKGLVRKTKTTIDDKIIKILHGPIFYSAIFIGWMIAIQKTSFIYFPTSSELTSRNAPNFWPLKKTRILSVNKIINTLWVAKFRKNGLYK